MHDLPTVDLVAEVQELLCQIPRGWVTTYGDLARALGDDRTRSARWLGEYLHHHPHARKCCCHRVVRMGGEIGLHVSGDPQVKAALLQREGVHVSDLGKVDTSRTFTQFHSTRPLERLRDFQKELGSRVQETPLRRSPRTIAGVDVAYRSDGTACGAYVLLDARTLEVMHQLTLTMPVTFPYIPGYLTFRELPVMLAICQQAREQGILGDVLFCDGNGRLHPWRAGIAVCLGVLLEHPTIGIGKSLLCGQVRPAQNGSGEVICDGDEVLARVLRASEHSRPVYLSVGNRLTLATAGRIGEAAFASHRVPEPIFHADRLSKRGKRAEG